MMYNKYNATVKEILVLSYASPLLCAMLSQKMLRTKKIFAALLTALLTVSMTLSAMFALVRTTIYVTGIASPAQRAVAMGAELLLGVIFLVGTVWLATHFAVRIFGAAANPSLPRN